MSFVHASRRVFPKTDTFVDRGRTKNVLCDEVGPAGKTLERLCELGIDMPKVTDQLLTEGVEEFERPFNGLIRSLEERVVA